MGISLRVYRIQSLSYLPNNICVTNTKFVRRRKITSIGYNNCEYQCYVAGWHWRTFSHISTADEWRKKKRRHISSRTHRRKSIYIHLIMVRIDAKADNTEFGCSETESETSDLLFDISIVQHLKCIPLRMCVAAKFILAKAI